MGFSQLIAVRGSVRGYKSDPVEPEKLAQLYEAVRLAPSASNRQPYKLYVIPTRGRWEELRKIYAADWFTQAPLVLCMVTMEEQSWKRMADGKSYSLCDAAIAMDHLILQAHDLGLGTCWIAAFNPDAAREMLNLPENEVPVLFTPLGYPAAEAPPKRRKAVEDLVVEQA